MNSIQITNTLTGKKEPFIPLVPGKVKMYVCGPTVYNFIHVGNARPLIFFDVVRRFLIHRGYQVTSVVNFTDVDDKIIQRAKEEGADSIELAARYADEYIKDREALKVLPPDHTPKVTEHMPEIIKFIEGLVANQSAYVAENGEVFFAVRKFAAYGKLSGKNVDDLRTGTRVDANEMKSDPLDFSLWKPRKVPTEPAWESPWGCGRPGWHIECSAMSERYLGESFDLHGGGMDLMHPHHENEIAQSEALSGKPFVKYWMHNNMLTVGSEKMSKSIGNIFLVRAFIEKYGPETLKYTLLSAHYRSTLEFSESTIRDSQAALHRVYSALRKCERMLDESIPTVASVGNEPTEGNRCKALGDSFRKSWEESLDDDFNTAKLLAYVFDYVRAINAFVDKRGFKKTTAAMQILDKFLDEVKKLSGVLNLFGESSAEFLADLKSRILAERNLQASDIENRIQQRISARAGKDFAKADQIRDELLASGIELRDAGPVTEWDVIFKTL